ncbi:MAG: UDP-N-acetylmuramate--L-alanine ligase [Phycisphaerae bacterium]|nr:UDP-N-acetylmuramate--L-alanine ligase [Phycisphaerae bacterium]
MSDTTTTFATRAPWASHPAGKRIHMIGIGGCGMSAAAALLLHSGARVSGSDMSRFEELDTLTARGAVVHIGHLPDHVPQDADGVVVSAAIPESNPELATARRRKLPVIHYAQLLGEIMEHRRGIAVAGTHGKSTTTALLAHILRSAGLAPSFIMGAYSSQLGGSSGVGHGEHFVVEACEYARSFLALRPSAAGILNIDEDHLDCYEDLDDIRAAFTAFGAMVRPGGMLITPHRERGVADAAVALGVRHETFGFQKEANWQAGNLCPEQGCYAFDVLYNGRRMLSAQLRLAGIHNVSNALMAVAMAYHESVSPQAIAHGIETFEGIARRMTRRNMGGGVTLIDDYAHHPTEINATLLALNARYQPKRTWVVFQPHQASRTRQLMHQFAGAFSAADIIIVADIYCVRDSAEDRARIRSSDLVSLIHQNGGDARYIGPLDDVTRHVQENVAEGDLVVTMGAGDVWKIADKLV